MTKRRSRMRNLKERKPWPHSKLVWLKSMPRHRRLRRTKNLGSPQSVRRRGRGSQRRTRRGRPRERCATVLFRLAFVDWFRLSRPPNERRLHKRSKDSLRESSVASPHPPCPLRRLRTMISIARPPTMIDFPSIQTTLKISSNYARLFAFLSDGALLTRTSTRQIA